MIIEHHLYPQSFNDAKANYKGTFSISEEDFADISHSGFLGKK